MAAFAAMAPSVIGETPASPPPKVPIAVRARAFEGLVVMSRARASNRLTGRLSMQ